MHYADVNLLHRMWCSQVGVLSGGSVSASDLFAMPGSVAEVTAETASLNVSNTEDYEACMSVSDEMFGFGAGEELQKDWARNTTGAGSGKHGKQGADAKKKVAKICASCARVKESMKQCTQCKAVYYCTVLCQKAHWKVHKQACLAAAKLSGSSGAGASASAGAGAPVGDGKKSEFTARALTDDEECSICLELVNEALDVQLPW